MRNNESSCPNGCKLPRREKVLKEINKNVWAFKYIDFNYCPCCGSIMPKTLAKIKAFFSVYHLHPSLKTAERLIYKSEAVSAAREAFVVVETTLRKKSGLDLHGSDLATKALGFEADKRTGVITKQPLIAINGLKTDSERNEQDGLRYMLMGFFRGYRNIYQHNNVGSGVSNVLSIVIEASFILSVLDGHSVTKNGRWIPRKMNVKEIYKCMPNPFDRIRLILLLLRRRRLKKR